jgi:uncharacterized membrane protein
VRDAVASSSTQQGTGSLPPSTSGFDADHEDSSMMYRVGQAAMVLSGAALVALAARQGRWKTIGAAALAGAPLIYRGATGHWPVPQSVAQKASDAMTSPPLEASLLIDKPAAELYAFWRRLENLPRIMKNVEQVVDLGDGRSHWTGKSALGLKAEWDAEIVDEQEGRRLSWSSLPGSQVHNAGTVWFDEAPNGRGVVVRVSMELAGGLGHLAGKTFHGTTLQQVKEELKRFKALMETGEVATTDGQPHGNRSLLGHRHSPL